MKYFVVLALLLLAAETLNMRNEFKEDVDLNEVELKIRQSWSNKNQHLNNGKKRVLQKRNEDANEVELKTRQSWSSKNEYLNNGKRRALEKRQLEN